MTHFSNTDDVIDSRDIIERLSELGETRDFFLAENPLEAALALWLQSDEGKEYIVLKSLAEECEQCTSCWENGEELVHESYFEEYVDEMVADCYRLPKDLPFWMRIEYDYEALKMDYTEVDFNGETYFIHSC